MGMNNTKEETGPCPNLTNQHYTVNTINENGHCLDQAYHSINDRYMTITLMETTPTTLFAQVLLPSPYSKFSLHTTFYLEIPSGDTFPSVSIYLSLCTSRKFFFLFFLISCFKVFVSVYSCISRIPKTFCPYLLTFFV